MTARRTIPLPRSSRAAPPRFNAARGSGGRVGRAGHNRESASESIGQASAHRKRTRILVPILGPFDWYSAIEIGIAAVVVGIIVLISWWQRPPRG